MDICKNKKQKITWKQETIRQGLSRDTVRTVSYTHLMHSLSRYSRSNQINREWIEEYLNEAHSKGLVSIRAH